MNRHEIMMSHTGGMRNYLIPIISAGLFLIFVAIALISSFVTTKGYTAELIQRDVKHLVTIFNQIEEQCQITGFNAQKNTIDFLNVQSFAGSEVGPMNLAHPEKWKGPYLKEHPEVQNTRYLVICTSKGYFVTPGLGVTLPNGKVIGKDIKLDQDADIDALMKDEKGLCFEGKALAAKLDIKAKVTNALLSELPLNAY